MRLMITGAGGMLGTAVQQQLAARTLHPLPRAALDVTDSAAVEAALDAWRPTDVLHLAAWTDVDGCEREPARALAVNGQATAVLAAACATRGIRLIYISSIAVFDGQNDTPYRESDAPCPANVYGASKRMGEEAVAAIPGNVIVRSGWLFGGGPRDRKFVSLILKLARERKRLHVVDDCIGSPTYVDDLAQGIGRLLGRPGANGIYHLVNGGRPVSRLGMAAEIVRLARLDVELVPVGSDYFPHLAPRPRMEAAISERVDGWLRPWPEALAEYLASS